VSPTDAAGVLLGAGWFVVGPIVVGPGGVFALHHGRRREAYVLEARGLAQRTERLLADLLGRRVPVTGLVTAVRAGRGFLVKAAPDGGRVVVVGRRHLRGWLAQAPAVLTRDQVWEIRAALHPA
jgi:hypothetical protein